MNQITINDDKDLSPDNYSNDEYDDPNAKKLLEKSTWKLIRSRNKIDKRFVNMHRVNQANMYGFDLGLKDFKENFSSEDEKIEKVK